MRHIFNWIIAYRQCCTVKFLNNTKRIFFSRSRFLKHIYKYIRLKWVRDYGEYCFIQNRSDHDTVQKQNNPITHRCDWHMLKFTNFTMNFTSENTGYPKLLSRWKLHFSFIDIKTAAETIIRISMRVCCFRRQKIQYN